MGYLKNHLATVSTGAFAAALTICWLYFSDTVPALNFVFLMAVPITWFLTLMCWLAQKSADYAHSHGSEKKSFDAQAVMTADGQSVPEIRQIQRDLASELEGIRETVKLKDGEIERLNQEISNLQTLVQIESLKTELANLKMLASKK
ncbi:MAG: hypothetical protein EB829_05805 [Nitrosopumilus sp. H8]|nr:MAG: hypothetical protein EB829_05805 [Nitrosopumilus sp. H8]RNJ78075.1 MAG: hypothetical protein EB830_00760 [Nitrosopumilus sp. H13]